MKKHLILALLCLLAGGLSMAAQGRKDALIVGVGYSMPSWSYDNTANGGPPYDEKFHKFDVSVGYEKFFFHGFFVMPQASLWFSDNPSDKFSVGSFHTKENKAYPNDPKYKAYQFGGSVALMLAWRLQFTHDFSMEFLTGPMYNLCFLSRVKGYGYTYTDLYRTTTFDWRFGLGFNIKAHLRLGVDLDLRPGYHKTIEFNSHDHLVSFYPSGENRRNAWRFSVGYRF